MNVSSFSGKHQITKFAPSQICHTSEAVEDNAFFIVFVPAKLNFNHALIDQILIEVFLCIMYPCWGYFILPGYHSNSQLPCPIDCCWGKPGFLGAFRIETRILDNLCFDTFGHEGAIPLGHQVHFRALWVGPYFLQVKPV